MRATGHAEVINGAEEQTSSSRGLKHMTDHILEAYREDIAIRRADKKILGVPEQAEGYKVNAHEIKPGTVYKDQNVIVKASLVNHADVSQAFGYRIETPDRTIVISGDARAESKHH